MSENFHYVRIPGQDGGVETANGEAFGLDLESILAEGLPPFRVALELIAGLCEVLDIAEEDGEVHGDIRPDSIFLDETGAVSIEGYGENRRRTRAPEGSPRGTQTDLYGLGYTAFRILSYYDMDELPDDDPDGHDDGVVDAILTVNLVGMPEEFHGDVQWYLAKLMSFDREDRPSAVEAWRTFIAFADATDGPEFEGWCEDAVERNAGERRDESQAKQSMAPPPEEEDLDSEDLGGPVVASGPLKKGLNFSGGGAAKGQATAFWSKDAMKAALGKGGDDAKGGEEEEDDDEFRPAAGGGSATAFWSTDQLAAMREGKDSAPKPKRGAGGAKSRTAQPKKRKATTAKKPPPKVSQREAPSAPPPAHREEAASHPAIQQVPAAPQYPPAAPAEGGGGNKLLLAGGGLFLLLGVGFVLLLGAAGIGYVVLSDSESTSKATTEKPIETPKPAVRDTGTKAKPEPTPAPAPPAATPKPRPRPTPKPTASPSPSPKPTPKPSPRPKPRPKPAPAPAPAPAPTDGPAQVRFKGSGRGSVSCAGTSKDFDGMTTLKFESYQLPATCLVTIEGKRGVFQVYGSGSTSCSVSGSDVVCDPLTVP